MVGRHWSAPNGFMPTTGKTPARCLFFHCRNLNSWLFEFSNNSGEFLFFTDLKYHYGIIFSPFITPDWSKHVRPQYISSVDLSIFSKIYLSIYLFMFYKSYIRMCSRCSIPTDCVSIQGAPRVFQKNNFKIIHLAIENICFFCFYVLKFWINLVKNYYLKKLVVYFKSVFRGWLATSEGSQEKVF